MGHLHMSKIQQLAREGLLGTHLSSIGQCDIPLCRACIHGKQHRRAISRTTATPLDISHLEPGDCVSGDQVEAVYRALFLHIAALPVKNGTMLVLSL
jgi:hypothetical protein